ncbi:MAG: hypothetical protein DCC67_04935 [Planctomycetota bacterium]|nr:MAG: hypothetical protein DCC67_04935 [Planctomycetota bacterium]
MTARKLACWFAAACAITAPRPAAYGQADAFCDVNCYHDMQLFAPVDFDFDCLPIERDCGWFFSYDKLSWATTGERTPIGTGNTDSASLNPFRQFLTGRAGDAVTPPSPVGLVPVNILPPDFFGGINSGPPQADFAWGERYEFGYFSGDNAWKVSVLDGPEANANQIYGLNTQNQLYGSVLVVFDDPANLMFGFIDVWNGALGSGGPFNPDGNADDLDNDGHFGPNGYDLEEPAQVPDSNFPGDTRGDFDDLVRLPTSFQFLDVRSSTKTDGIEIMKTYRLKNDHMMAKHQNNEFEIGAGVRYLRLRDEFDVTGFGGVMGFSFWDTRVDNNIVGPQIMANWTHRRQRVILDVGGRFLFGYNVQNFDQDASLGEDLIPGQYNRPLYFPAMVSDHGKQENFFSPTGEFRAQASYQLTTALALKLGYTAIFVDNISRSANNVRYELPAMGFHEDQAGKQYILTNGLNVGMEATF